jgi:hypothetical protein
VAGFASIIQFMRATLLVVLFGASRFLFGDSIQCHNGDRYNGKVLLVNETEVRLLNDIHGTLTIPRSKVVSIAFQSGSVTNVPVIPAVPAVSPGNGGLSVDAAAVEQVQREVLGTANPEANQLFQEMVQGLASGKLNVGDIRAKALSTLNEVRELQKELGDDDISSVLDSYVGILEGFVKQAGTNTPPPKRTIPATRVPTVKDDE